MVGSVDMRDADSNEVMKAGFVHWPIVDGFWYRDIQLHDMQNGDVRFASRVLPWTLYPPAVLKSHLLTPLFSPTGTRIGCWVVGFKPHWIANFLEDVSKSVAGTPSAGYQKWTCSVESLHFSQIYVVRLELLCEFLRLLDPAVHLR